jgi:hypothetical protein
MAITLDGTNGITTPDLNATAQTSPLVTTGDISAADLTLSGGVYLGGTGSANLLDDYEEGTYTPAFANGTFTYSVQAGFYTKVGRIVHFSINLQWSSNSSSSVATTITLPFSALATPYRAGVALGYVAGADNIGNRQIVATVDAGTTILSLFVLRDNDTPNSMDASALSSSGEFQFAGSYIVA